jgi:pectate lyase
LNIFLHGWLSWRMRVAGLILAALQAATASAAAVPAFPGAEGYGALATGGRGGSVYHVTNLNDSGPGSFRDAVSAPHRTVVFDVGGYIALKSVVSVSSDLTIAGQTAPGDGVGLRDSEISFARSHNVIVRYLRVRQGLAPKQERKSAININGGADQLIFDHVSDQWGRWDTLDMNLSTNITFQNCIVGPGVAPQRFGCLCQCENVTFSHNLFIDNQSRNPKGKGKVQYVNNVVYNWGVTGYVGGHSGAEHEADLIANYFIKGPSSSNRFAGEFAGTDHIFQRDNYVALNRDGTLDGRPVTGSDFGGDDPPTLASSSTLGAPPVPVTMDSAAAAYRKIVAGAGDSLPRDSVDTRLLAQLTSLGKTGKTIENPDEMGGFGTLNGGSPRSNPPPDGIPDDWKKAHGLDVNDPAVAQAPFGATGYTNLEAYLNSLVPGN